MVYLLFDNVVQICIFIGDEGKLRVYCYRAVLQYILKNQHPELIRPNVDGIKNAHNMNFQQFVYLISHKCLTNNYIDYFI